MPTFNILELKQSFLKSVEYLWRYMIFAGTVYRLTVGNLKCCRCAKFSPFHCKTITPAHLKFSTQMPAFNIFELKQSFLKSVEYLWRYRIFAGTVYRLKVGKLKCCPGAKFSPCYCKTITPAHMKLSTPKCRPSPSWRWSNVFENRVEYLWRYRIFAGAVYRLKVGKYKCFRCAKFSSFPLQNYNTCAPEIFHANAHLQHLRAQAKFSKIGWIPLKIEDFCLGQCTGWKWES